jgi:hypothetical protein
MMLGSEPDDGGHGAARLHPDPFVDRSGAWYPAEDDHADEPLYTDFAVPGCRLQRDLEGGPVAAFFPALNDVGYRCFEGSEIPGLFRFDDGVPLARFSADLLTGCGSEPEPGGRVVGAGVRGVRARGAALEIVLS